MASKLTSQQRHAAELLAAGDDQATVASKVGVNPSTVSRWAARGDFAAVVARTKAAKSKPAPPPAPTKPLQDLDFGTLARGAAATAWAKVRQRLAAGEAVPTTELVRIADNLRKFAEEDSSTTSPAAIAAALADEKTVSEVVGALRPAESARVWQALSGRLEADLGLDDDRVREAFQHLERVLSPNVAATWCHRWEHTLGLMQRDADRLEAWGRHLEVAKQAGDEPDEASVAAIYGEVTPIDELLSAASAITGEEATHAPA